MVNDQMVNIMKRLLFLHIILLFATFAWAQDDALPFECSFEESEDLSRWVLNPLTPNAADQWMIGTAVHSDGRRALYISADGVDPNYNKKPNVVAAYMTFKFPEQDSGTEAHYDISFDWKGRGDSLHSQLYAYFCPEQFLTQANMPFELASIVSETSGVLSNKTYNISAILGPERYLCGSEEWQNVSLPEQIIDADRLSFKWALVFLWVSDNQTDSLTRTSIAIDNIQICSSAFRKPQNLQVTPVCDDSTLLVTWESELAEFEVQYRKTGEANWRRFSGLMDGSDDNFSRDGNNCSFTITRIVEGAYDVRVRGVAEEGLSTNFVYRNLVLVYCPENHCINYIDLYNTNNVTCTYGTNPGANPSASPYDNVGIIDYGPDAIASRHTLHIDPNETDPRTDNKLHTVPNGALASVRLGNWNWGGEAESITYDILVDTTNQGILIVRYAIVFENPPGHDEEGQPRFNLEILDNQGKLIDTDCGKAEFTYNDAEAENSGWITAQEGQVAYKDWTTVGVSLMDYDGQNIKVRFTTMDCGWSGHYAYAYFTVDCANAHIETENCGNDPYITCKAPDGFAYEWRDETGTVPPDGNNQELHVDAGLHTYTCKVSFVEDPDCFFEISTLSAPRFPVPEYTYETIYGECEGRLKFHNTSHVMNKFDGYDKHTTEPCTDYKWVLRRLSNNEETYFYSKNPTYVCPKEGDTIEVTYTCYIGVNNSCDSVRVDTIVLPSMLSEPTEFHYRTCPESPVKFEGQWFDTDTVYVGHFENFAGCDSTSTLYLTVTEKPLDTYIHDSICSDQAVVINGVRYNKPLENYMIPLKTAGGCDSVVYLTLTVNTRIEPVINQFPYACADDGVFYISYDLQAGVYDSLIIRFSTPELRDTVIYDPDVNSVAIPYPATITPGYYTASLYFYQFCCGVRKEERMIEVRYSSAIVEQKWNDVLTMLAPKYNGGYEFTSFQWYKNNMPMEGETHSYIYQPLDTEAEYYVMATRKDGVTVATCPIQPVYHPQQSDYPSIVKVGERVKMYMAHPADIWYYTVSGQLFSTTSLGQGYAMLEVPSQPGVYILKSVNGQGETKSQVMIVQQ